MSNKQQQWLARLARDQRAQQTAADFCAAEGVSQANFYLWKRRLANTTAPTTPTLVPIQIRTPTPVPARTDVIELVLPSGAVLRFPATSTLAHRRKHGRDHVRPRVSRPVYCARWNWLGVSLNGRKKTLYSIAAAEGFKRPGNNLLSR